MALTLKMGNLTVENAVCLGPMAGVTDMPFRLICKEMGCGMMTTEMVSAKAVLYGNKNTKPLIEMRPGEKPLGVQIFGSDPKIMGDMAAKILGDFNFVDINMGCPVPKIVNNKEGSFLMTNPDLVYEIVKSVSKSVPVPVSVKIRKGFYKDEASAPLIAKAAESGGASLVTVHGRTREEYYSGVADWDIIKKVKESVSIPVIGNGDIKSGPDAKRMLEETGCDGIMVGRAARGNPWIFKEINEYLENGIMPERPKMPEIVAIVKKHLDMLTEFKGEFTAVREMRKHAAWYLAGVKNASKIRGSINYIETRDDLVNLLDSLITE